MSPLELSLNRTKKIETGSKTKIQIFNFFSFLSIILIFIVYAVIVNNRIGKNFEFQQLSKNRELLRESLRNQDKVISNFKVPSNLYQKVENSMVKVKIVNYLRDDKQEVALVKNID